MTDVEAIKDVIRMRRVLLKTLTKQCPDCQAPVTFWVLIELAVQAGIALYGKEECLEKISSAVNYIVQRKRITVPNE